MKDDRELVAVAEALDIPWRKLLENEIHAEREVRRCLGEVDAETPLWRVLAALQMSVLDSWRVRERIQALAWEARTRSERRASRELKAFCDHLAGTRERSASGEDPLSRHLEFAYRRIVDLEQAARVAEKCRGAASIRVRRVVEECGCLEADARWAVERALAPRERTIIEDAVRKARAEGFEIPRARTEFRSWMLLRRFLRETQRARRPRRAAPVRPTGPEARPSPELSWVRFQAETRFPMAASAAAR